MVKSNLTKKNQAGAEKFGILYTLIYTMKQSKKNTMGYLKSIEKLKKKKQQISDRVLAFNQKNPLK
jgi:hypothetical protein